MSDPQVAIILARPLIRAASSATALSAAAGASSSKAAAADATAGTGHLRCIRTVSTDRRSHCYVIFSCTFDDLTRSRDEWGGEQRPGSVVAPV